MGGIDLDPASNARAQEYIKAKVFYRTRDDGLTKPLHGRTWCNPPFSRVGEFVYELVRAFKDGKLPHLIMLVHDSTSSRWYRHLMENAYALCVLHSRIRFLDARDGHECDAPPWGSHIFYLGPNPENFAHHYGSVGTMVPLPTLLLAWKRLGRAAFDDVWTRCVGDDGADQDAHPPKRHSGNGARALNGADDDGLGGLAPGLACGLGQAGRRRA